MKSFIYFLLLVFTTSCIPLRIAPSIKNEKIMLAKKFKRKLPKEYAYIFEDTKEANEFYYYINTKFQLDYQDVEFNVPFQIDDQTYYLSFHEVEIPDKTFNILLWLIDTKRQSNGNDPIFEDSYVSRIGNWYLVLTVRDEHIEDCLKPDYLKRIQVISYLKNLKHEYLTTQNYLDVLLKAKNPNLKN
ncbi:MAG: hypothetical protein IMY67_00240 [Bacteroidetes bacterium]|nr:hypothetical protein [Bacteroidota bacterium]